MRTADGGTSTRIELAPFSTRYRSLAVSIWLSQANERKAAFGIARCQTERLKLGRAADHVHIPMLIPRLRPRPPISARLCPMLRSAMAGRPGCAGWIPPADGAQDLFDRKCVLQGKLGSVRVESGGGPHTKKKI